MSGKRRGRVSFADDSFADTTSLGALPPSAERNPTSVPVEQLAHNPRNPRESYDGESLDELAASLREIGQLQPITVVARDVYLAHHPGDAERVGAARWVVVMGNRRLAAARVAGLGELAVAVLDRLGGADPQLTEATLVENIHREALPPLLEARELQGLVERHGSQAAAAKRVAKTQGWVSQRLSLLRLGPEQQEQLRAGTITLREARRIASEPPESQDAALAELRHQATDSESAGETSSRTRPPRTSRKVDPPSVEEIAADLRRRLSADELTALAALITR